MRVYTPSSTVRFRPAASASSVLPVPALPTSVTRRIDSSSRRSSAKLCSLLRGRTPMTPFARHAQRDDRALAGVVAAERRVRRVRRDRACSTHVFGRGRRLARRATRPSRKNASTSPPSTSSSIDAAVRARSTSTRWFSYVSATMPSASARMRRFVSIVTKIVGRPPSFSRTSNAVCRMAWSIARVVDRARQLEALARDGDAQDAARVERHALGERAAALAKLVEQARDRARVAPALRALALELVDLLDDVDRDDDVVVLEPEDGVRVVEEDVRVEDVVLLHSGRGNLRGGTPALSRAAAPAQDATSVYALWRFEPGRLVSSAAQRLAPAPAWFGHVELVLGRAASEVRILSALTPCDARGERARLTGELRAGRPRSAALDVRAPAARRPSPRARPGARRARAQRPDARSRRSISTALASSRWRRRCARPPARASWPRWRAPASSRASAAIARAASALCASVARGAVASRRPRPPSPSDDPDPASLLSRMRAAVGRLRLPFSVVASAVARAARGDRRARHPGRDGPPRAGRRRRPHGPPRDRGARAPARPVDARHLGPLPHRNGAGHRRPGGPRRPARGARWLPRPAPAQAARRAALGGRSDARRRVVRRRRVRAGRRRTASTPAEAVVVAERAFRGGDGSHPGLGRERVYLESFVRVRRHLAAHPDDDAVLASGQVAVDAADTLRPFADVEGHLICRGTVTQSAPPGCRARRSR